MKVVGICGSPRRGNTEWMLRRLLEAIAQGGAETELILLRRKNIKSCNGCLACEVGGKARQSVCTIQDDMQEIYPKLLEADCLVLGTPVYFEMLSGLLKNFIDRTCPIWPRLEGKLFVGIAVAEEGVGKAIENLRTYCSVCGMSWGGYVTALAKTPSQVSEDTKVEKKIQQLASKLISKLNT
jgi:multimeric flavodoxin WrbA